MFQELSGCCALLEWISCIFKWYNIQQTGAEACILHFPDPNPTPCASARCEAAFFDLHFVSLASRFCNVSMKSPSASATVSFFYHALDMWINGKLTVSFLKRNLLSTDWKNSVEVIMRLLVYILNLFFFFSVVSKNLSLWK